MANKHLESLKFPGLSDIYTMTPEIASEYSSSATYAVGEYAVHSGKLYQCTTAIATAEAWTAGHWTEAKLADDVSQLKEDLTAVAIRPTVSGSIASFTDGAEDVPMKSLVVNIEPVQSGSGDPSPSNVRPISGWSAVNTTRTGSNQFNGTVKNNTNLNGSGQEEVDYSRSCCSATEVRPNTEFSVAYTGSFDNGVFFYDENMNFISLQGWSASGRSFTTPNNTRYVRFSFRYATAPTDICINIPSTITEYKPYEGQTYTTALGQTVYGGKLDVVSGELVIDRAIADLGTLTWASDASIGYGQSSVITGIKAPTASTVVGNIICTKYLTDSQSNVYAKVTDKTIAVATTGSIRIYDTNMVGLDNTAFQQAMSGVMLVYELATPITVQLTPQEITTLLGDNNVFADAGAVDVTYLADGKMYIDNKIAELQALILEQ